MQRDFKGVWIPREIWLDERLTPLDRIILAEIDSLDHGESCYASNEYLAEFCQCSSAKITKSVAKLRELGYIELAHFDGRRRFLRSCLVKSTSLHSKKYEADSEKVRAINIDNNIVNNINKKERRKEKTFEEIFEERQIKGELKKAFVELIKSRKLNNRKMTDRALELSINKVRRMSQDEETQIAIINQSIENGWQGLFPLKEVKSTKTVAHITQPGEDRTWKRVFDFWEKALGYKPSESEAEVSAARQLLELEGEANTQKLIVALRMRSEHRYLPSVVKNVADLEGLLANRESVWAFYTKNEREWAGWHEKQQEGKKRWEL